MRRVGWFSIAALTAIKGSPSRTPARTVYTTWGEIACENWAKKESWFKRITSQAAYRSFEFWHVPEVDAPSDLNLSPVELYLLSCLEDDTTRLLSVAWGNDFDPFWKDRVQSHESLFNTLYHSKCAFYKFLYGDHTYHEKEKLYIERKLNYLKDVFYWASVTERHYTALAKVRFHIQREVWNALERERYLCACVEVVESLRKQIPEEFSEKAMSEMQLVLVNLRHWVCDCPNGKRTFTRQII
ncbi:unnamed protein product [Phytomonas sp. Hart1]|nr:unnamed protein product [Phytomonas sp. Hart1]|eukprot:CCW68013.1 unnamed protein product [Phytomonas sp. isolate Hart1]